MINRTRMLRQSVQRLLREDYPQRRAQLQTLPKRIATERARLETLRATAAALPVPPACGKRREEQETAITVELDRLTAELELAQLEVQTIDGILEGLPAAERRTVERMDLRRQHRAIEYLCEELGYEKTAVYEIYDAALDAIARLYFGRT